MTQDTRVNKLLTTLYSAPLQPELWGHFLTELATVTHVTKAALLSHHEATQDHRMLAVLGDETKESTPLYESHFYRYDEWTLRFPKNGVEGRIVLGEEVWPDSALKRSVFYNEFLKKFDTCQMACLAAVGRPGEFEVLSIYRGLSEAEFSTDQLTILQSIAPHLQTALYTRRKLLSLQSRIHDLESSLDHLATAVALFDSTGKVVFVNRAARQILDQRDGLSLEKGRLAAQSLTENTRLREILVKAVTAALGKSTANPGAMRISRLTRRPLHLTCAPMRSEDSASFPLPGKAVAILFLTDPDHTPAPPAETLRILFQLTPAESRLAIALLHGQSPQQIADTHQVNRETIRTQLKSLFQKTGTHRQSDLIRLLASLHPTPAVDPS